MIARIRHKGLRRLYEDDDASGIRPDMLTKVRTVLMQLDAAEKIEDMDVTSFRLHPLKGNLKGFWAVTINANWRIIFRLENGAAFDVDLMDYH